MIVTRTYQEGVKGVIERGTQGMLCNLERVQDGIEVWTMWINWAMPKFKDLMMVATTNRVVKKLDDFFKT